jgi:hypothetical protein
MKNWISVKDRLPDIEKNVLLILKTCNKDMAIGYLYCENVFLIQLPECQNECDFGDEECNCCNIFKSKEVTYWMELPEPPKENEE